MITFLLVLVNAVLWGQLVSEHRARLASINHSPKVSLGLRVVNGTLGQFATTGEVS